MLGHSELESTQIYAQVPIRQLKKIQLAIHPGASLEKKKPAGTNAVTNDELCEQESRRANLLATLDAEAQEEE